MSIAKKKSKGIRHRFILLTSGIALLTAIAVWPGRQHTVTAQAPPPARPPVVLDSNLIVRTEASGLVTPISIAFLGRTEGMLVLERNTGRVKRLVDGKLHSTVLDLGVNFASERGLLGISLHPNFPFNPGVYLYWTCRANVGQDENTFRPEQRECADAPTLGPDTDNLLDVPMLGNRVDR